MRAFKLKEVHHGLVLKFFNTNENYQDYNRCQLEANMSMRLPDSQILLDLLLRHFY